MVESLISVMPVHVSFGEWFAIRRRRLGLSQLQVAEKLGVSRQTIGNWESGLSVPEMFISGWRRFALIMNCTLDEIPGSKDEETDDSPVQ